MTAEIAVINQQGVALAADSAVTIGRKKVWKTANKLFSLSPHNDIGIMIYGTGDFIGLPWETIVKWFRRKTGCHKFSTLQQCADSFLKFLRTEIGNPKEEEFAAVLLFYKQIKELIEGVGEYNSDLDFRKKSKSYINRKLVKYKRQNIILPDLEYKKFIQDFEGVIDFMLKEEFKKLNLTKELRKLLYTLFYEVYKREVASDYETGLVIAGFGEDELLPSLLHYNIDGKRGDTLRSWQDNNSHDVLKEGAAIIPFAQSDMFKLFLEGIAPEYSHFMFKFLHDILNAKSEKIIDTYVPSVKKADEKEKQKSENKVVLEQFLKEFHSFKRKIIEPFIQVVGSLPKEEMAVLAEALVELTSLRRKMDSNLESVGGPTDVAIISKGDGFIWVKRKHYFDPRLNMDFVKRKELQLYYAKEA